MPSPQLVSATEIAELLGVTRQRVQQLAQSPTFPAPLGELKVSRIRIWREADVVAWAERTGRALPGR